MINKHKKRLLRVIGRVEPFKLANYYQDTNLIHDYEARKRLPSSSRVRRQGVASGYTATFQ